MKDNFVFKEINEVIGGWLIASRIYIFKFFIPLKNPKGTDIYNIF